MPFGPHLKRYPEICRGAHARFRRVFVSRAARAGGSCSVFILSSLRSTRPEGWPWFETPGCRGLLTMRSENGSVPALLRALFLGGLLARRLGFLRGRLFHCRFLRRAVHHGLEAHAVGVVKEHPVIFVVAIMGAGRVGD